MVLYLPVKQQLYQDDLGCYQSFGIAAWNVFPPCQKPFLFIPDIALDRSMVCRLCWRCTLGQLAPNQLMDVVEDTLCTPHHKT